VSAGGGLRIFAGRDYSPAMYSVRSSPAAGRTGLLSSRARMQPSARGRLRAADRYAIDLDARHSIAYGAAGCRRLRRRICRKIPQQQPAGCRSLRDRACRQTHSLYPAAILLGPQPAERAHDCKELRASAARRLRPARPFQGRNTFLYRYLRPRAFAGRSCGPLRLQRSRQFSIQNDERLPGAFGLQQVSQQVRGTSRP